MELTPVKFTGPHVMLDVRAWLNEEDGHLFWDSAGSLEVLEGARFDYDPVYDRWCFVYNDAARSLTLEYAVRSDGACTVNSPSENASENRAETQDDAYHAAKRDAGKRQWTLLLDRIEGCGNALADVVDVLTFGAQKYAAFSWRKVPDARRRYEDALHRHLDAIRDGQVLDPESGLPHWAHVGCNALFLAELDKSKESSDALDES